MRNWFFFLVFLSNGLTTFGQNLVPNPSFEDTILCPGLSTPFYEEIVHWGSVHNSNTYFYHFCSTSQGVPINQGGNQLAHSGNAYISFWAFNLYYPDEARGYPIVKLTDPLQIGMEYVVSFYVSLMDKPQYAVSKIGALLSVDSIFNGDSISNEFITEIPQIEHVGPPISDKDNWTLITDTMTAQGGEQYLVIGNFRPDSLSDTLFVDGMVSWLFSAYYLDDVSVVLLDTTVSIPENYLVAESVTIFPNPAKETIQVSGLKNRDPIRILDLTGRELDNFLYSGQGIDVSWLSQGLYLVEFSNATGIITKRFIKE